ncbi:hypothetical protein [Mycoplasma sp. VS30B]
MNKNIHFLKWKNVNKKESFAQYIGKKLLVKNQSKKYKAKGSDKI